MTDQFLPRHKPKTQSSMGPLFAALARAKAEIPDIPRNRLAHVKMRDGRSYSYSYADLADVLKMCTPALSAHGLAVVQWPDQGSDGGWMVHTMLTHESGASWTPPAWPVKSLKGNSLDDAQGFQGAVQMAKRYGLTAALGITTEETVEGDTRLGRDTIQLDDNFDTPDGKRLPVGAKIEKGWTPRQIAEECARAIIAQMEAVKTVVGLHGVWERNVMFTEKMRDKFPDLFSNVFDEYAKYQDEKPEGRQSA